MINQRRAKKILSSLTVVISDQEQVWLEKASRAIGLSCYDYLVKRSLGLIPRKCKGPAKQMPTREVCKGSNSNLYVRSCDTN